MDHAIFSKMIFSQIPCLIWLISWRKIRAEVLGFLAEFQPRNIEF
jgi:hypothetical protein